MPRRRRVLRVAREEKALSPRSMSGLVRGRPGPGRATDSPARAGTPQCSALCWTGCPSPGQSRSEEHTSELQSRGHLVCRLLLEKKKTNTKPKYKIQQET